MDEKWTKTSVEPPSGVMNPNPFSPLNHFTVPCAIDVLPIGSSEAVERRPPGCCCARQSDPRSGAPRGGDRTFENNSGGACRDLPTGIRQTYGTSPAELPLQPR